MATHAELIADVVIATGRPDLVATGDIDLAIRRATLKLHSMACWPMDLAETVVTFADTALRTQSINTLINLERFRCVKYIREYTAPVTNQATPLAKFFARQEPDAVLDDYNTERSNVWYLGGSNINLRGRAAVGAVTVGWFQYPVTVSAALYSSWIANIAPFCIVDEAAQMIFKSTGNLDMARAYEPTIAEHKMYLLQNFIDGEGR